MGTTVEADDGFLVLWLLSIVHRSLLTVHTLTAEPLNFNTT